MKTYPMKARIRNEGTGPARIDIFDDIGAGGWFSEGYTPASFADAIKDISGPLDIHINSGGGDVADGIAIANAIRGYPGRKRTVVDGMAASIASVIAQAGDERVVEPGAMLMIHDPLTAQVGNEADFLKTAQTLGKHGDNLAQQYADRAGGTAAGWRDVMRQETWYTADEAVAAGLADRVGTAVAQLPQGVDVDALAAHAPARIMAALRSMPQAAAGDDGDDGGDSGDGAVSGAKCKTCDGKGRLPHPGTGKNGMKCPGCKGSGTYDPDGDGDDDSTAEGDTDHDYVLPDGSPGPAALTEERVRAIFREELRPALAEEVRAAAAAALRNDADSSPWDGGKAMAAGAAADDPAAFYKGICAGRKEGDAAVQSSWALPYRYAPGDPPNAAGVKAALGRLPQVQGLVNEAEAKKTLQAAMKQVNPDYEPEDSTDTVFSQRLRQMRAALPALKGADA